MTSSTVEPLKPASSTSSIQEDKNWKNVGNWHWVSKDLFNFAKEYLSQELPKIKFQKDNILIQITEVTNVEGDCHLNVRKGKLITIYDLKVTFKWQGEDGAGTQLTGRGIIPEIAHDTEADDFAIEITPDSEERSGYPIKEIARKHTIEACLPLFTQLSKVFMDQGKDVYIEGATPSAFLPKADLEERKRLAETMVKDFKPPFAIEDQTGKRVSDTKPTAVKRESTSTPNLKATSTTSSTQPGKPSTPILSTSGSLSLTCDFQASVQDISDCFLVCEKLKQWTQGQGHVDPQVGGQMTLYGGQVQASFEEIQPTQFKLKWKFQDWSSNSQVTITLKDKNDSCQLVLSQSNYETSKRPQLEGHWNHVFKSIKMCFGYGGLF